MDFDEILSALETASDFQILNSSLSLGNIERRLLTAGLPKNIVEEALSGRLKKSWEETWVILLGQMVSDIISEIKSYGYKYPENEDGSLIDFDTNQTPEKIRSKLSRWVMPEKKH